MVFQALRIDKITQGVKIERKKGHRKKGPRTERWGSPILGGGREEYGAQRTGKKNTS